MVICKTTGKNASSAREVFCLLKTSKILTLQRTLGNSKQFCKINHWFLPFLFLSDLYPKVCHQQVQRLSPAKQVKLVYVIFNFCFLLDHFYVLHTMFNNFYPIICKTGKHFLNLRPLVGFLAHFSGEWSASAICPLVNQK